MMARTGRKIPVQPHQIMYVVSIRKDFIDQRFLQQSHHGARKGKMKFPLCFSVFAQDQEWSYYEL